MFFALPLFALVGPGIAMSLQPAALERRTCYTGEATALFCYTKAQGTPQDVKVADIQYAAQALREYGTGVQQVLDADGNPVLDADGNLVLDADGIPVETLLYRFLNMSTATAPSCGEWAIFSDAETVLIAAKLMTKTANGLVVCRVTSRCFARIGLRMGYSGMAISQTPLTVGVGQRLCWNSNAVHNKYG